MITFNPSTEADIPVIREWAAADIYHRNQSLPEWWITGQGLLSFCLHDNRGPVFYVRIDDPDETGYAELNVQFAPVEVVSKIRLTRAILQTLPKLIDTAKAYGSKGFIFDSESPLLVDFMSRLGIGERDGRFYLTFGE